MTSYTACLGLPGLGPDAGRHCTPCELALPMRLRCGLHRRGLLDCAGPGRLRHHWTYQYRFRAINIRVHRDFENLEVTGVDPTILKCLELGPDVRFTEQVRTRISSQRSTKPRPAMP